MSKALKTTDDWVKTVVSYRLSTDSWRPGKGAGLRLRWKVKRAAPDFAGFALVANQAEVPASILGGIKLYRWIPAGPVKPDKCEASVSLDPVRRLGWQSFYCKLFVVDAPQDAATLVIHPDTCVKISNDGHLQTPRVSECRRKYRPGTPKTIVCLKCFHEFPIEQMRFSAKDEPPIPAKYTFLNVIAHAILGRKWKPKVPRDTDGTPMSRRFCPRCDDELPSNAGLQDTLIVGLAGANACGKATYIAALVNELMGDVGNDIQMVLVPVTGDTPEYYKTVFYEPLFKMKKVLSKTPCGVQVPPLTYDLSVDGRLWREKGLRSVNLALYNTAGENLDYPEMVERFVKYVRPASAIMLLVDPLQIPRVRELVPKAVLPSADAKGTPDRIVANIFRSLEGGQAVGENKPFSIPVAVVLTKCDVLRDAGLIKENRLWSMTDRRNVNGFDVELHNDMNGMTGELMRQWDAQTYHIISRHFPNHAFFGVSSTGCAPEEYCIYPFVSPWRVEQPLLWILAKLGFLPIKGDVY